MDVLIQTLKSEFDRYTNNEESEIITILSSHLELPLLDQLLKGNNRDDKINYYYILTLNTYFSKKISCNHSALFRIFLYFHSKYSQHQRNLLNLYKDYLLFRLEKGTQANEKLKIISLVKKFKEYNLDASKLIPACKENLDSLISVHIMEKDLINSSENIENSIGYNILTKLPIIDLPEFEIGPRLNIIFSKYYPIIERCTSTPNINTYHNIMLFLCVYSNSGKILEACIQVNKLCFELFPPEPRFLSFDNSLNQSVYSPLKLDKRSIKTFADLVNNIDQRIPPVDIKSCSPLLNHGRNGYELLVTRGQNENSHIMYKIYKLTDTKRKIQSIYNEIKVLQITSSLAYNDNCFIKYYGSFIDNNTIGIAMEFAGTCLNEIRVIKDYFGDEGFLKATFIRLLCSFQELIENNIYHSDIKPGNITMTDGFIPKIIDYGACLIRKKNKNNGKVYEEKLRGTQQYSSPQLFWPLDKKINLPNLRVNFEKNDVFSLGMVFLEMATQENCQGLNNPDKYKVLIEKTEKIRFPKLKNVIKSMLNIDTDERPSFKELISRLS